MAQEQDFSLISVHADEEDDIVIQAGAVDTDVDSASAEADYDVVDADVADADPASGTGAKIDEAADDAAREEYLRHQRKQQARRMNEMVTTEEDLHAKMPFAGMQKGIMAVLLLLIVAAVVYWIAFR